MVKMLLLLLFLMAFLSSVSTVYWQGLTLGRCPINAFLIQIVTNQAPILETKYPR